LAHEEEQVVGDPDVSISLILNDTAFRLNAPTDVIEARLTLAVEGEGTAVPPERDCLNGLDDDSDALIDRADPDCHVVTSDGVSTNKELYQLRLVFTDPDGLPVIANQVDLLIDESESPPPPLFPELISGKIELIPGEPVETLLWGPPPPASGPFHPFALNVTLPDARTSYTLTKAGFYSVLARIPYRQYAPDKVFLVDDQEVAPLGERVFGGMLLSNTVNFALVADADGDGYCFPVQHAGLCTQVAPDCNDNEAAINPGASEVPNNGFDDDCNPATPDVDPLVNGTVILTANLHTVGNGNHPGASKDPLPDLPVRLFDRAHPCLVPFSMSWQNYPNIYENCPTTGSLIGQTLADGTVTFSVVPANYLVIAKYVDTVNTQTLYPGVPVGNVDSGETTTKQIQVIVKSNGKSVPGKTTKKTGSELLIIEPEYVEWDGETELYPFIFESIGDWSVTTSVSPPEGFVADVNSLSEEVNTTLEAVQFTLTDIGSDWVDTSVTHDLTHKGKKEKVKTKVGVKLSKELAKAKGLTRLGQKPKKEK
jgi:hypothetical protein